MAVASFIGVAGSTRTYVVKINDVKLLFRRRGSKGQTNSSSSSNKNGSKSFLQAVNGEGERRTSLASHYCD